MVCNNTNALLEYLQNQAKLQYLSDLHRAENYARVCAVLFDVLPKDYALPVWNEAIGYITQSYHRFNTVRRAHMFLLEYLQGA